MSGHTWLIQIVHDQPESPRVEWWHDADMPMIDIQSSRHSQLTKWWCYENLERATQSIVGFGSFFCVEKFLSWHAPTACCPLGWNALTLKSVLTVSYFSSLRDLSQITVSWSLSESIHVQISLLSWSLTGCCMSRKTTTRTCHRYWRSTWKDGFVHLRVQADDKGWNTQMTPKVERGVPYLKKKQKKQKKHAECMYFRKKAEATDRKGKRRCHSVQTWPSSVCMQEQKFTAAQHWSRLQLLNFICMELSNARFLAVYCA